MVRVSSALALLSLSATSSHAYLHHILSVSYLSVIRLLHVYIYNMAVVKTLIWNEAADDSSLSLSLSIWWIGAGRRVCGPGGWVEV